MSVWQNNSKLISMAEGLKLCRLLSTFLYIVVVSKTTLSHRLKRLCANHLSSRWKTFWMQGIPYYIVWNLDIKSKHVFQILDMCMFYSALQSIWLLEIIDEWLTAPKCCLWNVNIVHSFWLIHPNKSQNLKLCAKEGHSKICAYAFL